jgi:hypothetical protein
MCRQVYMDGFFLGFRNFLLRIIFLFQHYKVKKEDWVCK